ncbi:MAG TPA: twin-arginine translocase subunit TatC [Verrucomicrobiae bacterium]|nr:twin-arginine translocase subunit TatC [Verrucomicrobiae bacterium]
MADDPDLERLDGEENEGGPVKSFLEHLEDLRWVLIKSAAAVAVAMLVCLLGGNTVVWLLKRPLEQAEIHYPGTNQIVTVFWETNKLGTFPLTPASQPSLQLGSNRFVAVRIQPAVIGTNQVLTWQVDPDPKLAGTARKVNIELVNLSPAGGFIVAFQVAVYTGLVLSAPFIIYFVMSFVFPALKITERKYVYRGMFYGGGLFLCGVAFCYFFLLHFALAASQRYSEWLGFAAFQWRAEDYISFVCKFMLGMGLGFEMPVVILTLVKIGVLNYAMLSKGRRYMIVINLFLGAVLTTPEVLTQLIMFLPLQVLYEISIWVTWWWERKERQRREAAGEIDVA